MITYTNLCRNLEELFQCNQFQAARFGWAILRKIGKPRNDGVLEVNLDSAIAWLKSCQHDETCTYDGSGQFYWIKGHPASAKGIRLITYCKRCGSFVAATQTP